MKPALAILLALLTCQLHARRQSRVLVVANSNSEPSLYIAQRYCELRKLPPWQLLALPFASRTRMSDAEFASMLKSVPDSVDVLALSFDVPYRLGKRSVSGALLGGPHAWYQSQIPFERALDLGGRRILPSSYLSAYNVRDAERMLQDAQIRYASPQHAGTFYFCTGVGPRGLRNPQNQQGMEFVRGLGGRTALAKSHSLDQQDIFFQMTGFPTLTLTGAYRPGSIVDNMTSLGGYLRDPRSQSTVHDFIRAGASGGYGCVLAALRPLATICELRTRRSLPERRAVLRGLFAIRPRLGDGPDCRRSADGALCPADNAHTLPQGAVGDR